MSTLREHLRAAAVLAVGASMLIAAPPGLEFGGIRGLDSEAKREAARAQYGEVLVALGVAFAALERGLRRPLAAPLLPLQRAFRIEQTWNFYPDGLGWVYRLEIDVDDALVFRMNDPEHAWLAPQLTCRRLRPLVQATAVSMNSRNSEGVARFVVRHAREDFPDASEVVIRSMRGAWPGDRLTEHHRLYAGAPEWTIERAR
jgi:hypothetical protein